MRSRVWTAALLAGVLWTVGCSRSTATGSSKTQPVDASAPETRTSDTGFLEPLEISTLRRILPRRS